MTNLKSSASCGLLVAAVLAGCGDPAPPNPRGSLNLQVGASPVSQYASLCLFGTHQDFIGGDPQLRLPNEREPGPRQSEGISCRVSGSEPYHIEGRISAGTISMTFEGTVPAADFPNATGQGDVFIAASYTVAQTLEPLEPGSCTFTPIEVASGEVWTSFNCPVLQASGQLDTYCGASGYLSLINCDD